ncbi:MAG: sigma-70 family RNA polymerase sigma factor [Bacteroidetes bacterium]|nr:sigma-70 family RNA polymerase sigma factor [Bacteroidota bacterium]MBX7044458.1 sigma-70 family RNA polymerase sigma factor [Ignavibacteria bacterium]
MSTTPHENTKRDINLLRRISSGDESAIGELYDFYNKYLFTTVYFILKDEAEAEDVLQEAFFLIWDKIDTYDERLGNPISWMTRICRNKAIDKLRARKQNTDIEETNETLIIDLNEDYKKNNPEFIASAGQEQKDVLEAISELDETQKKLIEYAYYQGFSHSELSAHFNIPLGTVKTKIRSAMMILRERLKHLN